MISALIIYLYQRGLECKAVETHKPEEDFKRKKIKKRKLFTKRWFN